MDINHKELKRIKFDFVEQVNDETVRRLQDLSEDCLLEVFSADGLDLTDLCSIAETCKYFKNVVGRFIPKELIFFCDEVKLGKYGSGISDEASSDMERIFKSFGSLLTKASISHPVKVQDDCITKFPLLKLVTMHCVGNLKNLEICAKALLVDFKVPQTVAVALKPIFEGLHTLCLGGVFIDGDKTLFENCNSLVHLQLSRVTDCGEILDNVFPKLEAFTYINIDDSNVPEYLSTFILRNSTLKNLKLNMNISDDTGKITIPQAIAKSCTNLEELRIGLSSVSASTEVYLQPLQQLKSLRGLFIAGGALDDLQLFATMTELRELSLLNCTLRFDYSQFALLTQVTHLDRPMTPTPV